MNTILPARSQIILLRFLAAMVVGACLLTQNSLGQFISVDLESEPLQYSKTRPSNRISKLVEALANGSISWKYEDKKEYLVALLEHLNISESSQVLVFSKTSMQVQHISPRNPRAIYFNDDTYVGWIHGSSLVEISTNDPKLGAAFYTLRMTSSAPRFRQETYQCLGCHATTMTKGVPGHTVRSGFPNYDGIFDVKREAFVTDETSDFKERWGGWYVTGDHGDLRHMGNAYLRSGTLDTSRNGNRQSLDEFFDVSNHLHIESTHHTYLKTELPRLDLMTEKVARVHGDKDSRLHRVRDAFVALRSELEPHMMKEERILFPIIRSLEASSNRQEFHCGSVANPIRQMESEHDHAGNALSVLNESTDGYTPPDWACNTYRAMLDALKRLESNMHQHVHKENNVLFPKAIQLEQSK